MPSGVKEEAPWAMPSGEEEAEEEVAGKERSAMPSGEEEAEEEVAGKERSAMPSGEEEAEEVVAGKERSAMPSGVKEEAPWAMASGAAAEEAPHKLSPRSPRSRIRRPRTGCRSRRKTWFRHRNPARTKFGWESYRFSWRYGCRWPGPTKPQDGSWH
jgi:hypothetical protein